MHDEPESESMNKLSVEELDIVKGDVELPLGVLLNIQEMADSTANLSLQCCPSKTGLTGATSERHRWENGLIRKQRAPRQRRSTKFETVGQNFVEGCVHCCRT